MGLLQFSRYSVVGRRSLNRPRCLGPASRPEAMYCRHVIDHCISIDARHPFSRPFHSGERALSGQHFAAGHSWRGSGVEQRDRGSAHRRAPGLTRRPPSGRLGKEFSLYPAQQFACWSNPASGTGPVCGNQPAMRLVEAPAFLRSGCRRGGARGSQGAGLCGRGVVPGGCRSGGGGSGAQDRGAGGLLPRAMRF